MPHIGWPLHGGLSLGWESQLCHFWPLSQQNIYWVPARSGPRFLALGILCEENSRISAFVGVGGKQGSLETEDKM